MDNLQTELQTEVVPFTTAYYLREIDGEELFPLHEILKKDDEPIVPVYSSYHGQSGLELQTLFVKLADMAFRDVETNGKVSPKTMNTMSFNADIMLKAIAEEPSLITSLRDSFDPKPILRYKEDLKGASPEDARRIIRSTLPYHSANVTIGSMVIGYNLGLSDEELQAQIVLGLLHDVGKLENKCFEKVCTVGKLTESDYEIIKSHPRMTQKMISNISHTELTEFQQDYIYIGAGDHHENVDGTGYPNGKSQKSISQGGLIIPVPDGLDASTKRADRICGNRVLSYHEFMAEARELIGRKYAREVVAAMDGARPYHGTYLSLLN